MLGCSSDFKFLCTWDYGDSAFNMIAEIGDDAAWPPLARVVQPVKTSSTWAGSTPVRRTGASNTWA